MNHWLFITAAYVVTLASVASALVISWRAMRAAERQADAVAGKR